MDIMIHSVLVLTLGLLVHEGTSTTVKFNKTDVSAREPVTQYLRQENVNQRGVLVQPELLQFFMENRPDETRSLNTNWDNILKHMFSSDPKVERVGKVGSWTTVSDIKKYVNEDTKSRIRQKYPIPALKRDSQDYLWFDSASLGQSGPPLSLNPPPSTVKPEVTKDIIFLQHWHDQFGQLFTPEEFESKGKPISSNFPKIETPGYFSNFSLLHDVVSKQFINTKPLNTEEKKDAELFTITTIDPLIEDRIDSHFVEEKITKPELEIPKLEAHISFTYDKPKEDFSSENDHLGQTSSQKIYDESSSDSQSPNYEDVDNSDSYFGEEYHYTSDPYSKNVYLEPYRKESVKKPEPYFKSKFKGSEPFIKKDFEQPQANYNTRFESSQVNARFENKQPIRNQNFKSSGVTYDFPPLSKQEFDFYTKEVDYKKTFHRNKPTDKLFTPHFKPPPVKRRYTSPKLDTDYYLTQAKDLYRNPTYPGYKRVQTAREKLKNKVIYGKLSPDLRLSKTRYDKRPQQKTYYYSVPKPKNSYLEEEKQGIANEYLTMSGVALAGALVGYFLINSAGPLISREKDNPMKFVVQGAKKGLDKLVQALNDYEENLSKQGDLNSTLTNSTVDEEEKLKLKEIYETKLEQNKQNISKIFDEFFIKMTTALKADGYGANVFQQNQTDLSFLQEQHALFNLKDQPAEFYSNLRNLSQEILKNNFNKLPSAITNLTQSKIISPPIPAPSIITSSVYQQPSNVETEVPHRMGYVEIVDDLNYHRLSTPSPDPTTTVPPNVVLSKILTFSNDKSRENLYPPLVKPNQKRIIINNEEKVVPKYSTVHRIGQHKHHQGDIVSAEEQFLREYEPKIMVEPAAPLLTRTSLRIRSNNNKNYNNEGLGYTLPSVRTTFYRTNIDDDASKPYTNDKYFINKNQFKKIIINNEEKYVRRISSPNEHIRSKRLIESSTKKYEEMLTKGFVIKNEVHIDVKSR